MRWASMLTFFYLESPLTSFPTQSGNSSTDPRAPVRSRRSRCHSICHHKHRVAKIKGPSVAASEIARSALSFLSTFPIVIPFIFVGDAKLGAANLQRRRHCNAVSLCLRISRFAPTLGDRPFNGRHRPRGCRVATGLARFTPICPRIYNSAGCNCLKRNRKNWPIKSISRRTLGSIEGALSVAGSVPIPSQAYA
jgi:hypothetical protein